MHATHRRVPYYKKKRINCWSTGDSGQIRGAMVEMGRLQPPQKMSKSCGCSCHPKTLPRGGGIILDTDLESLMSILLRSQKILIVRTNPEALHASKMKQVLSEKWRDLYTFSWGGCSRPRYPFLLKTWGGCSRPIPTSAPRICPLSSVEILQRWLIMRWKSGNVWSTDVA